MISLLRWSRNSGVALALALALTAPLASVASASANAPVLRVASTHPTTVLSWSAPASPVLGYVVMESSNGTRYFMAARVVGTTSFSLRNLRNGLTYEFLVIAELRGGGVSLPSNVVLVGSRGAPAAPRNIRGIAQPRAALVSWYAPSNDGGRPITRYVVSTSSGTSRCGEVANATNLGAAVPGPMQHCVVRGLRDGVRYRFRVVAVNALGAGTASTWSPMVRPGEIPVAPLGVSAQPLDSSALVTWSVAPGGARATSFRVTALPGDATCTSRTTSCTVSGLVNGASYIFSVVAIGDVGTSAPSAPSSAVQPNTVINLVVGPFTSGSATLSTDVVAQVQSLANTVEFSGANYVRLVGGAATTSVGLAEARAVAAQLTSDLATLGITGITMVEVGAVNSSGAVAVTLS